MKRIGKYVYADAGMTFMLNKEGLDYPPCKHAFIEYGSLGKVPADWIDMNYVREAVNNGKNKS